jgi:hypothetical protein
VLEKFKHPQSSTFYLFIAPLDPGDPTPVVVRWHREDGEDITMRTVNGERLLCNSNPSYLIIVAILTTYFSFFFFF